MPATTDGRVVYISEVPVNEMPPLFANEPDAFDMNHAAGLRGVTRKTIQRAIERGKLRCFHGRGVRQAEKYGVRREDRVLPGRRVFPGLVGKGDQLKVFPFAESFMNAQAGRPGAAVDKYTDHICCVRIRPAEGSDDKNCNNSCGK